MAGGSMAGFFSYFLDCRPVSWFVNMAKIRAGVDDLPLLSGVDKEYLVVVLLALILLFGLVIGMDYFRDASFPCKHRVCRPMRRVMGRLTWMGTLGVMITLPPSLAANGYGVYELYPYVVGFVLMFSSGVVFWGCLWFFRNWDRVSTSYEPRSTEENNFGRGRLGRSTSYSDIRKEVRNLTWHAGHLIDIGCLSVRLPPVVLMLLLIAIRWNPLHILIMFFFWTCLNIAVMQSPLPPLLSRCVVVVPLRYKSVEWGIRHLDLSPLEIFLLKTGNSVFNMAKPILYTGRSKIKRFARMIRSI